MFRGDLDALILVIIISTKKTCLVVKSAQNNDFGSGNYILQSFSVASVVTVRTVVGVTSQLTSCIQYLKENLWTHLINKPYAKTFPVLLLSNSCDSTLNYIFPPILVYFNLDFWIFAFSRENKWNLYDFRSLTYWGIKTVWQWRWQELATSLSSSAMWPCWEAIRFSSLCLPPCQRIASYMFLLRPVDGW